MEEHRGAPDDRLNQETRGLRLGFLGGAPARQLRRVDAFQPDACCNGMPDTNMGHHLNGIPIDNAQHGGGYGTKPWFMGQHDARHKQNR